MHRLKKRRHRICVCISIIKAWGCRSTVSTQSQKRARWLAGWVCLLAIVFMYAPLAGALVLAQAADCCVDGYCKVPAHHHRKITQRTEQAAQKTASESTCEHQHSGMTQCTMSCCPDATRPAVTPVAFVLPTVNVAPEPGETLHGLPVIAAAEILRLEPPLFPPPRLPA
jgi:hypothetical protein